MSEAVRISIPSPSAMRARERKEIDDVIEKHEARDRIVSALVEEGVPMKSSVRFAEICINHSIPELGRWLAIAQRAEAAR